LDGQYASPCQILCQQVKACDVNVFYFSRLQPSAFLDYWHFQILTSGMVWVSNLHHRAKLCANMCHFPNFCANRSNCSRGMVVFPFFKMAVVHHLGFVLRLLFDNPRSTVCGYYRCAKFDLSQPCSFEDWEFQCYASLIWKGLFMPLLGCFWG